MLQEAGAELVFFSPLAGKFPEGVSGLYLGGGYPERHAEAVAANAPVRAALKAFACAGGVIYAECGGLIYLSQSIQPLNALPVPMVGIFPFRTHMTERLKTGYVEVNMTSECALFPTGPPARGHIHHFSEITQACPSPVVAPHLAHRVCSEGLLLMQYAWPLCLFRLFRLFELYSSTLSSWQTALMVAPVRSTGLACWVGLAC